MSEIAYPPDTPLLHRLRRKARMLLQSGHNHPERPHQVGLLPTPGWGGRNYRFVRHVLLPELLRPRRGTVMAPDLSTPVAEDQVRVTWIGHATFLVQFSGCNVLIDPNWSNWLALVKRVRRPGILLSQLPRIDLVLVSHAHFDHLQLRALKSIARGQPIVVPSGVAKLVRNRGFGDVVEMHHWQKLSIAGVELTFTPAKHWGARMVHDVDTGFGGFFIRSHSGKTVFHCGDSAYFSGFQEIQRLGRLDLALLPIGAYESMSGRSVHMSPEEAVQAFRDLQAAKMIPMHYGTFPLGVEPLAEPLSRFQREVSRCGLENQAMVLTEGCPKIF